MNDKRESNIKKIRESQGLSRKDLAQRSGVNFRSIQDYEQGHKDISSAKAETVYRLSQTLGCDMEALLQNDITPRGTLAYSETNVGGRLSAYWKKITDMSAKIEKIRIRSSEYKTSGYLYYEDGQWKLKFTWKDEVVCLPFDAVITVRTLPWIEDIGRMKMEQYIKRQCFYEKYDK